MAVIQIWLRELGHDFHKYPNVKIIDKLSNSLATNGFKGNRNKQKNYHPFHLP